VFGFRASKMRQGKISALIHHSKAHPSLNSCRVEIHFHSVLDQPDGTVAVIPDSQLVVARQVFKNNSSKYYINDRDSSFTEVTTLMREKGIDLDHKRFLILQGEVESIAQMKPKAENENDDGLLEYLEDIIGTSSYKKIIEESTTKLEESNEECTSKSERLELIKNEIGGLEDQKNEIVGFMKLENQLTSKKSIYYQISMFHLEGHIKRNKETIDQNRQKLEDEKKATDGYREEIVELERELKQHKKELDTMKREHQSLTKQMSKAEIQKVQFEEKSKHMTNKQKKLEKTISSANHALNEAQLWITNYDEEVQELNGKYATLEESLKIKSAELAEIQASLRSKTTGITEKIEAAQRKLEPWKAKILAKESEIAVAHSEVELLREKHVSAKETLRNSKHNIEAIMTDGKAKEAELDEIRKELVHVVEQIELGGSECEFASKAFDKMKGELEEVRQKVQSAKDSVASIKSQGRVLESLTKLSNSGRVDSFHGRLGSLGTIDSKYDIAISTACPALDNLVVDTVEAGQQCVEYLRKNNIGRAKFILLEKLPKRNLEKIQTPEDVPRLFDLVKFKHEKFAPAFYSVLADTLVAKDAEQARRIAYGGKRWRVVSLQGMLIDKSGTMSGGGQISKGKMKSRVESTISDSEMQRLEKELEDREAKYRKAESTLTMMETMLVELKEKKPQLELQISKLNLEIETLEGTLIESQKQHKELSKDLKRSLPKEEEIKAVEEKEKALQAELEKLRDHSSGLTATIAELQEKIMEIGGVKLRFTKSEVDSITEQLDLISQRLSKGLMEKTKKENELKKQTRIIENAKQEIDQSSGMSASSEKDLLEKIKAVQELEAHVEKLGFEVEAKADIVAKLKENLEEKRANVNSILSAEIEINNLIEQHENELRVNSKKLHSYKHRLKELQLHVIGDLEEDLTVNKNGKKSNKPEGEEESAEEEDGYEEQGRNNNLNELQQLTKEQMERFNLDDLKEDIAELEDMLKDARIDMQVLKEYRRRATEFRERQANLNSSISTRDELKQTCEQLRQKRLSEFMEGFNLISMKLKEMYQMITMGGNAELELVDSLDPFSEGIIFSVMPPKKSWKNISNLSGGEKTLSSLALVFALHHYKPTPLYVMDEIDAALDFRNVSIVANYIKERTKNGQFIVISLRNNMFELANQLVGIYKVNSMTKSIALQNQNYIK
jgi:structural maintenance of chromosome 4